VGRFAKKWLENGGGEDGRADGQHLGQSGQQARPPTLIGLDHIGV
jgi:hypothetical protein